MKNKKIGVLLGEKLNPFWTEMGKYYKALAPEKGFEIECFWPFEEMDEEAQLKRLEEMIKLDFDFLVINPLSDQNLVPGIIQATRKGIHVIDVGEKTNQEKVKEAKPLYAPLKTVDFYQQGVLGAQYIIKKLQPVGQSDVAIMEGRKKAIQSVKRSQGAADTFQKNPFISVVKKDSAHFDRDIAKVLAKKWLQEIPSIKAFFCANDLMALGVAEVVRPLRRSDEVIIVGVDFIQESKEAIEKGILNASVAFSTESVAQAVLESALKVLKGEKISNRFQVGSKVVDKKKHRCSPVLYEEGKGMMGRRMKR
jgi:ABC-type sugar transport system substrate-binding protein